MTGVVVLGFLAGLFGFVITRDMYEFFRGEKERPSVSSGVHRHLIVRHVHPDWHGHCDRTKRGFKSCDRPHWHFWWRHEHADAQP